MKTLINNAKTFISDLKTHWQADLVWVLCGTVVGIVLELIAKGRI